MSANTAENTAATIEATVEAVTEAVKNATIGYKSESGEDAAHAASAAEGRRLYIGNLAYSTTDEQLKEFFTGFDIESTSIPTHPRTGRAVGYAFVDLKTKEEAERAIAELSGKEVVERKVSVQLAKKPGSANGVKREAKEVREAKETKEGEEGAATEEQPKKHRGGFRGRGGRRGRGSFKNRANRPEQFDQDQNNDEADVSEAQPLGESTNVKSDHKETTGASSTSGGYKPKRKRGPPENGVPSVTKIMVANLPYELSEEKLKELFADYQPESAKIALRPIPRYMVRKLQARGEPRKGRGFGFVTLASEEMQLKAVAEMNGKEVDGREIAVKVAIDSQVSDSEDKENAAATEDNDADGVTAEVEVEAEKA